MAKIKGSREATLSKLFTRLTALKDAAPFLRRCDNDQIPRERLVISSLSATAEATRCEKANPISTTSTFIISILNTSNNQLVLSQPEFQRSRIHPAYQFILNYNVVPHYCQLSNREAEIPTNCSERIGIRAVPCLS